MTKVSLLGMEFYAFHGYYDFERRVGSLFVLDVEVDVDLSENPHDKIEDTVNYEDVYAICKRLMNKKFRLLETLVFSIADEVKSISPNVLSVKVSLSKLNPPIGGKAKKACVSVTL